MADASLYPQLASAARRRPELEHRAARFRGEMAGLTAAVLAFLEKYGTTGSGVDFACDVGKLLAALDGRIRREEAEPYPAYDAYVA